MKTDAVIFTAPNTVEFGEVTCREPSADDVVVRTRQSWISNGTEGSYLRGERVDGDRAYMPGDKWPFPVIAGYQKIGTVEWTGAAVTDLAIGEVVFVTVGFVEGMHHDYAGQVRHSVTPRSEVYKLPVHDDPLKYAGMVLTQVGYNSGIRPAFTPGAVAVVGGDGLVGQWTAQTLVNRGARVILLGRRDSRLALFERWCSGRAATGVQAECHCINTRNSGMDLELETVFGVKASIGIDTVGSLELMNLFSEQMHRFGHLVSAGFYGVDDRFALQPARYGEHTIHLVSGFTRERMELTRTELANNRLETLSLITDHFPVEQAATAWKAIESKDPDVLGVILDWE